MRGVIDVILRMKESQVSIQRHEKSLKTNFFVEWRTLGEMEERRQMSRDRPLKFGQFLADRTNGTHDVTRTLAIRHPFTHPPDTHSATLPTITLYHPAPYQPATSLLAPVLLCCCSAALREYLRPPDARLAFVITQLHRYYLRPTISTTTQPRLSRRQVSLPELSSTSKEHCTRALRTPYAPHSHPRHPGAGRGMHKSESPPCQVSVHECELTRRTCRSPRHRDPPESMTHPHIGHTIEHRTSCNECTQGHKELWHAYSNLER